MLAGGRKTGKQRNRKKRRGGKSKRQDQKRRLKNGEVEGQNRLSGRKKNG